MSEFIEHYVNHCRNCAEFLGEESKTNQECYECYTSFSRAQRSFALKNPSIYSQAVILPGGDSSTVVQQAEYLEMEGEIKAVFGVFAVTTDGVECLTHNYVIENSRLHENDWESHMSEKTWVNVSDFKSALNYARSLA